MAIKAKELAKLLGVSTATISLVLNHKPGICEGTRQQLIRKIIDMGYGYMLRDEGDISAPGNRGSIAFVFYAPEAMEEDLWDTSVLQGAEAAAREMGYDLKVVYVTPGMDLKCCLCPCSGFIVKHDAMTEEILEELASVGVPFVVLGAAPAGLPVSSISTDNEQGICSLVEYLKQQGHTRIGYIACGADQDSFQERAFYWEGTLQRQNLPFSREWRIQLQCGDGLPALPDVNIENGPTAYLCDDDRVALRAVKALERQGLQVPEDVSLTGFGDCGLCAMVEPHLTTVRVNAPLLGRESVNLLLYQLRLLERGESVCSVRMSVAGELVVRQSICKIRE